MEYPNGLRVSSVQNPAQAWNALTVGGYTEKVDFHGPKTLDEQEEIANVLSTTEEKNDMATNKKTQFQDFFRALLHELISAKTWSIRFSFRCPPKTCRKRANVFTKYSHPKLPKN